MSGFDADWLALREPVDHRSRNRAIAATVGDHFAGRASLTVVDLGCGTGSNLRALAPLLPSRQYWQLIDGDPRLLAKARQRLGAWAESVDETGAGMVLHKDGRRIDVRFACADLVLHRLDFGAPDCDGQACGGEGAGLVTAAALFDLVSRDWLERLIAALARRRVPLYAVLTYDGEARWRPEDPRDAQVIAAFNRHQRGDKGFGPALGPAASEVLAEILARHGYAAAAGDSPWDLQRSDAGLIAALTAGFADAAAAIETDEQAAMAAWGAARARAESVTIGHRDVFATR